MDYIQPCKKYKYFVATASGEMPTLHKYDYERVLPDLGLCIKGWPDKKWCIYRLVYVQNTNFDRKEYLFDRIDVEVEKSIWQQSLVPALIAGEINQRYTTKAVKV